MQFFTAENALIIPARSQAEAFTLLQQQYERWSLLASEYCLPRAFIQFPGAKGNGLEIRAASRASQSPSTSYQGQIMNLANFHSSDLPLSRNVLAAMETIAENPDEQWFLHLMKDNCNDTTQVALTESCRSLIVGATPTQALNRKRSDYTHPEDLPRMMQHFRSLSVGGRPSEAQYRLFSPVYGANSDTWRRTVYDYQLVDETQGGIILLSRCRDVQPIERPILAMR